ncbi:hypothetical protein DMENIID0001_079880 [Sergentomyia squamirostris]
MGFLSETLAILVIFNLCGLSQHQDQQNYFFTQNQGRFIPSYQNPRNPGGYFGPAPPPRNPQPGSFQEQTLYVGGARAPNTGNGQGSGPLPDSSTTNYFPFQPFTTTRHPELFDISPRPFGGQVLRNNGLQFQRIPQTAQQSPGEPPLPPQPLVPDFPPRILPPQQPPELFLNQIGLDQGHLGDLPPNPRQQQHNRGQQQYRPSQRINNDAPGRNDKIMTNKKAPAGDDYFTSQEETFRSRNRFRGSTEVPLEKNVRVKSSSKVTPPDAIELNRKSPVRKHQKDLLFNEQLLRSRPVPYDQPQQSIPPFERLPPEPPRINISHNGSTKQSNELPAFEENYPDYYYDTLDESLKINVKNSTTNQVEVQKQEIRKEPEPERKPEEIKEESTSQEQINPNVYVPSIDNLHDTNKHIRDNKATLEETPKKDKTTTELPQQEEVTVKEDKPDDHTVILTSNFYLPDNFENEELEEDNQTLNNESQVVQGPDDEEYDYEDYGDDDTNIPQITTANPTAETVLPTATANEENEEIRSGNNTEETESSNIASPLSPDAMSTTTESWVVIASVQTSRSVSGARFLPFPQVEQEEKKQVLSDLDKETKDSDEEDHNNDDDLLDMVTRYSTGLQDELTTVISTLDEQTITDTLPETTSRSSTSTQTGLHSTESIIDKLDRVQSELSSGVFTGKFPILNETLQDMTSTKAPLGKKSSSTTTTVASTTTSTTTRTTKKPDNNKLVFETLPMDDLAGLLPAGYKNRVSYKNKKITTTTSTTTAIPEVSTTVASGLASLMNSIAVKDVSMLGLLPKDYKLNVTEESSKSPIDLILKKAQHVDISAFLPSEYVASSSTTPKPSKKPLTVTLEDNISKFLPPGYNKFQKTTKMPSTSTSTPSTPVIPIVDDLSKFLPPGFKLNEKKEENVSTSTEKSVEMVSTTTVKAKVVFPSRPGFLAKKPGQRITTPKSVDVAGPATPDIVIRHGPPTRATTEFTGWPTPSTTPFSIEKLLELQRTSTSATQDFISASTTTRSTTTTTMRTTTQRPTEPGICQKDCDLAATIKIISGVMWTPEFLDHNTDEWKSLARDVESQLNSVYGKHPELSKWFRKVRIDSFSKGSVLVDYFVELVNMPKHINTQMLKKLFHSALTTVPTTEAPDLTTDIDDATKLDDLSEMDEDFRPIVRDRIVEAKIAKETLQLGHFAIDPTSTDFIVIPKQMAPTVEFAEENQLLPQWAIAVIVIGVGSLFFVIVFGVTVLINRKNKAKKKAPAPLTADMLNELNKNHMGGVENYGHEEFYNVEDAWDDDVDNRQHEGGKSKRYGYQMHGSQPSNIYDSWRSSRHPSNYYDSHPHYPQKVGPYPAEAFMDYHQAPPSQHNSMPMYTYNPRRYRDYDEDF